MALLTASSQALDFNNSESAGNATIDNENDTLTFNDQSDAGTATVDNDTGTVIFNDQSTAANATIVNIDDATTEFYDQSSAGSATLTNELDGSTEFHGSSSASDVTIFTEDGGSTEFNGNSTAGNARLIANDSGFVDFSGSTGPNGDNRLSVGSVEGSGNFFLGSVLLSVGSNNLSTEMSGQFSDGTGAGLTKVGTGILTLSGDSSDIFNAAIIIEGGLINFNSAASFGDGSITLDGGGLQWATGTTTDISDRLTPLGGAGGVFDTNGNDVTLATALSGSGALSKTGNGLLLLNAINSYGGGTLLQAGTLRQGVAGGLVGNSAYTINGGTLDLNDFDLSMSSLAGSGGALALGSAHLTVNQTGNSSYAGSIGGSGGLTKLGVGTLTLSGNSSYTGATQVDGGSLLVNGSLLSAVTVGSGAILGGDGSVGATQVDAGGTLAPGNSIGTLFINGDLSFDSASIYQVEVDPAGNTDLLVVSGQAGLAGTVQVLAGPGAYALGTVYSILQSGSPLLGQFDAVTSNLAFLDPSLTYSSNEVFLTLLRNDISFESLAITHNQRAFATGARNLPASNEVLRTLINLDSAAVPDAYSRLSGDAHPSFASALLLDDLNMPWMPLDNLSRNLDAPERALPFWVQLQGGRQKSADDGNAGEVILDHEGLLFGGDWPIFGNWRLGAAFGYGPQQLGVSSRSARADTASYRSSVYAGNQMPLPGGKLKFSLGATYSEHQLDSRRNLQLVDGAQRLVSDYAVGIAQGFSELSYRMGDDQQAYLEPFARLVSIDQRSEGFRERGGSAALTAASQASQLLSSTLGLRGQQKFKLLERELVLKGALAMRQLQGDLRPEMELRLGQGEPFEVQGTELPRNSLLLDVHADYAIAPGLGLDIRYKGMTGSGSEGNGFSASLRWRL